MLLCFHVIINPFLTNVPILYPNKTPENVFHQPQNLSKIFIIYRWQPATPYMYLALEPPANLYISKFAVNFLFQVSFK